MPVERLESGAWPHPARLPLGCGYAGHCTAPGHEEQVPHQDVLEASCNLGYAANCEWAPRERVWDAVRFAVAAPPLVARATAASADSSNRYKNAADLDRAHTIRICYACERDHRPVERGDLEFDLQNAVWLRRHDDARVQKMAECFLDSYLKKKY
jgi:hypothetical protein